MSRPKQLSEAEQQEQRKGKQCVRSNDRANGQEAEKYGGKV